MDKGLGRLPAPDERDKQHLLQLAAPAELTRTSRYWYDREAFLDQGREGACVGFGWTHWVNDGPVTRPGYHDAAAAFNLYKEAQLIDEWPGEDYEGTSVRAGAKVLQSRGLISEYKWAFDLDTVVAALLNEGPIVMGTNWYNTMFQPGEDGFLRIHPDSRLVGGHAYVLNGINVGEEKVRLKNSWGKDWGQGGRAWLSFNDLDRLIREDGEACLALEAK